MANPKPKSPSAAQGDSSPELSKFQKFETAVVARSEMHGAPYNPRMIDDHAKRKLRKNLERNGLVQPVVWNKRTGNVVGGHQRLAILDTLEGNTGYALTVAVVDVDEKTEKEMNVFLNNAAAQGEFDPIKLGELLIDVDIEETGFDRLDLELILEDEQLAALFNEESDEAEKAIDDLKETKELSDAERAEHRAKKKQSEERAAEKDDPEFFRVLVFRDRAESDKFAELVSQPVEERYLNGTAIYELVKGLGEAVKGESLD